MADLSTELVEKIRHARSLDDIPADHPMVPYKNVGDLLLRRVDEHEEKPFLIFYDDDGHRREYTYREFFEEVCKAARYLAASGIGVGDRIAIVSHNHAETVIQYFAGLLVGTAIVPVNLGEDDRRISYVLENSGAKLAFVRDQYIQRISRLVPPSPLQLVETGDHTHKKLPHFATEIAKHAPTLPKIPAVQIDDDALIVYTSGTTGHPKGVILSQYNLLVDAMAIAEWHQFTDDQRMMCVLPLHHVNGIVVTLMTPLYAGSGVVLNQRFHPDKFFERIAAERVSIVSVVPTLLQFLLHSRLDMETYKLKDFRHIICGAGPLTVELAQKFEQTFKIPIMHGYGLSETTCYSCFLPIDLTVAEHRGWMTKHGFPAIGVPLPINDMAIHDPRGSALPEGERGEIVVRGHNVMKYYYQNPAANEETFANGWFRSGDEGFYLTDDQGRMFFFITGRMKELIIRGGANISPFEIDEVLMHVPGAEAAIAVGFENDWYGEEVGAFVKPKAGREISAEQVLTYCRKFLPFSKSPKVVVFGNDIPITSTGKYQRNKLKALFEEWKTTQFTEKQR